MTPESLLTLREVGDSLLSHNTWGIPASRLRTDARAVEYDLIPAPRSSSSGRDVLGAAGSLDNVAAEPEEIEGPKGPVL